jgi:hypothetical protein
MMVKDVEQTNRRETGRKYSIFWDRCLKVETTGTGTCQFYANTVIYMDLKTDWNVSFLQHHYSESLKFQVELRVIWQKLLAV